MGIFKNQALKNERGVFDLASVMVGAIVLGIMSTVAVVSVLGVILINSEDAAKNDVKLIRQSLNNYHSDGDSYPSPGTGDANTQSARILTELTNGGFLPPQYTNYVNLDTPQDSRFCYYSPDAELTTYSQQYEVTIKSSMGNYYHMNEFENIIKEGKSPNCQSL